MKDVNARSAVYLDNILKAVETMKKDFPAKAEDIVSALVKARNTGKRVYICGNGGSASTASHMASDLNKGANRKDAPRFKAIALTDNIPAMLAWANDSSYDDIFVEQLRNHLEKDDIVIGISGSGNSANVLKAIDYANSNGALTIGLAGIGGGKLAKAAGIAYIVPNNVMQQVEDLHLLIEHMLSMILRDSPDCA
ncbi:MAG TPA: SIS domain-containing protein [Thermoplasmata archaeon]